MVCCVMVKKLCLSFLGQHRSALAAAEVLSLSSPPSAELQLNAAVCMSSLVHDHLLQPLTAYDGTSSHAAATIAYDSKSKFAKVC
jgi:hypothetical protein